MSHEQSGNKWESLPLEAKVDWLHEQVVKMLVRNQIAEEEITAMLKELGNNY